MALYSSGVGPQSYPTARAQTRNTQVPQYSNYQPLTGIEQRLNDPAQMQSAADEINARNAQALGAGGQTWWRPNAGEGGGYSQMLNPSNFTGLVGVQGAMPDYMRKGAGAGSGSTNTLAPEIISKMWR
jgi:predicted component of type VI protein secretion system